MLLVPTSLNFPAPVIADLGQVSRVLTAMVRAWNQLVQAYSQRINGVLPKDGTEAMTNPLPLEILTVATLPAAASWTGSIVYASDTGGVYLSNGSAWTKLASGLSSPVSVPQGGTSLATLTANAVMLGEGTAAVGFATTGTLGRVLEDRGAATDPSFQTLSQVIDDGISSTQGSILYRDASAWKALGPGTSGNFLKTQGAAANPVWAAVAASGQLVNVQTFTASTTYNRTAGVTKAIIFAHGPGGAGASGGGTGGAGGGGGEGGIAWAFLKAIGATETVTISATTSTFGAWAVAGAGTAGTAGAAATGAPGGAGGAGTTGDLLLNGAPGGTGVGGTAAGDAGGGAGGGQGGGTGKAGANGSGAAAAAHSGAGGGGSDGNNTGGAAASGYIIVWEFS